MKTHQILIASYTKDFQWLHPNLLSLRKFCEGFLPPVISVDEGDYGEAKRLLARVGWPEVSLVMKNGRRGQGFMRAQISMMECDLLCPNADFIYLVGSDCLAHRRFAPDMYFVEDKPVMLYNSRKYFEDAGAGAPLEWINSTQEILGFPVNGEFMRRLPIHYPRELFAPMRAHVEATHRMNFEDYIYQRNAAGRPVSESNILGGFAWEKMHDLYYWMHADGHAAYTDYRANNPDPLAQFWSHGGLDRPCETTAIVNGRICAGRPPREIINEVLGPCWQ